MWEGRIKLRRRDFESSKGEREGRGRGIRTGKKRSSWGEVQEEAENEDRIG